MTVVRQTSTSPTALLASAAPVPTSVKPKHTVKPRTPKPSTKPKRYFQPEVFVSPEFRAFVLAKFPLLPSGNAAEFYLRMMRYLLFAPILDEETERIVLPHDLVAELARTSPHTRGFNALRLMKKFAKVVFPLNPTSYCYSHRKARTVVPELDEEFATELTTEFQRWKTLNSNERVEFVTAQRYSRRGKRKAAQAFRDWLQDKSREIPANHPARELLERLDKQSDDCFNKYIRRNLPAVLAEAHALPERTLRERAQKRSVLAILHALETYPGISYRASPRTRRIFTCGLSIHQLPRRFRKQLLDGGVSLDLQACQLAVVAMLWELPKLSALLKNGKSFWKVILTDQGLTEQEKPLLKMVVYAMVFGMVKASKRRQSLERLLEYGSDWRSTYKRTTADDKTSQGRAREGCSDALPGLGRALTLKFFRHPLIQELMEARDRQQEQIRDKGGAYDAFGQWIPIVRTGKVNGRVGVRSVMAQQAQSYELKIMLAMLPTLQQYSEDIRVLSWLHDGVTLHFTNATKRDRLLKQICKQVTEAAREMGIHTALERE